MEHTQTDHDPEQGPPAGSRVKDPVCGMMVDPGKSAHHADHAGTTHHFCSAGCRGKFAACGDDSSLALETADQRFGQSNCVFAAREPLHAATAEQLCHSGERQHRRERTRGEPPVHAFPDNASSIGRRPLRS